ncbi:ATP-binding protein, partial [Salmonella enterica subsp. enterica]
MEKGVELVLEGDEECWVQTEPVALAIALQNLVTNALNFSPVGGEVRVVIGVNGLRVEDQGPGIDEAQMGRLFERFYSRDNANGA